MSVTGFLFRTAFSLVVYGLIATATVRLLRASTATTTYRRASLVFLTAGGLVGLTAVLIAVFP